MPDSYPYIVSNNKIEPILARIRTAAKPDRLGREMLTTWGFTASNDRAISSVLKGLGFLTENNTPTAYYDRLRDPTDWKYVLAEQMHELYADLYAIDSKIHNASDAEIKGAMSRLTGKDEESVKRYYATFKTLATLANFEGKLGTTPAKPTDVAEKNIAAITTENKVSINPQTQPPPSLRSTEYHYNIQIHLPVTTDISVYNAIFKSLKENLGV